YFPVFPVNPYLQAPQNRYNRAHRTSQAVPIRIGTGGTRIVRSRRHLPPIGDADMLLTRLWTDERGFVISSELVLLGTLGVLGATAGLHVAATAIDEELFDVACAFRSLDQSYY